MFLRNESQWNVKKFGGFYVDDGTTLLPAPSKPTRTIEFIGDSWTAGYGVEAGNCNLNTVSDVNKSWAGLTRDAFHAHGSFLAWSGRGMVHNLEDATNGGISPDAVPHYYDSIVCEATWFSGTHQWDFSKMDVNLVVICLGINDYSTNFPGSSAYITAYRILSTESGVITPMPKS
jgi:lysophospholipase L1-like esterase